MLPTRQQQQDCKEIEKESKQGAKIAATTPTINRRKRILIVDDCKDLADILKMGLKHKGFEADVFDDPYDALENFKVGYYDVVISDVRMPGLNGFELCKELLKMDNNKLRIFFMSAYEAYMHDLKEQFPDLDDKHFIDKPISIDKLAEMISDEEL